MRCPRCDHAPFNPNEACPQCSFQADPARLEELAHIRWLLAEIDGWPELPPEARAALKSQYRERRESLEVKLGLRPPPLSPGEIETVWRDLHQRRTLLGRLDRWLERGWIAPAAHERIAGQARAQVDELQGQLGDIASPLDFEAPRERLALNAFLKEALTFLNESQGFVYPEIYLDLLSQFEAEREALEVELGLRPEPASEPRPAVPAPATPPPATKPTRPAPKKARREPLSWDRVWRTLLSERTLQAILFLGIFFIFVSATTLIVFNWNLFPPYIQLSFIVGFTAAFYAFGWYVRTRMKLYSSGIALSAIGSLLVPFDFYAVYLGGGFPQQWGDGVWLGASLFCLLAYTLTTAIIRDELFGYLVAVAGGSAVLAALQALGLAADLRAAGLAGLALLLAILAEPLARAGPAWRPLARPFRRASLLAVAVLMPLTLAVRYITRVEFDLLHVSLVLTWWVGGILFADGAVRHRSGGLEVLAAITLPVAVYLTQAMIFDAYGTDAAWHALGLALLTFPYFWYGHRRQTAHGQSPSATAWGHILLVVAALWSLTNLSNGAAAAASHAVLSLSAMMSAVLRRKPAYLGLASFLAMSAMAFGMSALGFSLPQLTLGWTLLAILHLLVALQARVPPPYARPLYLAAYAIAALAVLPPLLGLNPASEQSWLHWRLLAYGLGNWILLSVWGAILAHRNQPGFPSPRPWLASSAHSRGDPLFHWLAALPLPLWVWLAYLGPGGPGKTPGLPDGWLAVLLAGLAWATMLLARRLRALATAYAWPWYAVGLGLSGLAVAVALPPAWVPERAFLAGTVISAAGLYFATAWLFGQRWWLAAGGLTLPLGGKLLLDRLGVPFDPQGTILAALPAAYLLLDIFFHWRAHRRRSAPAARRFFQPLFLSAHLLALVALGWSYAPAWDRVFFQIPWTDAAKLWAAGSQLLLGAVYGLVAWDRRQERWGHASAWLGVLGAGLIAVVFSSGRGSSAAKAAGLAAAYVFAERLLHWLPAQSRLVRRRRALLRLAWSLYRRPLLVAGWSVSAGAIGLALVRNLLILGGRSREIWAIVALLLVAGLYAVSARLFRQPNFLWLAAPLLIAPWTLLTKLGWFTAYRPTVFGYALGWAALAWGLLALSLWLARRTTLAYDRPLFWTAQALLPVSLLWAVGDVDTGRITMGLGVGFYGLAALADHRNLKGSLRGPLLARFLYPALGLIPVWSIYLMAWLAPAARHEHYGLLLLLFAPLGLIAGIRLKRRHPADGLPAYLTGYACAAVGTMLVAHDRSLLAGALLYDALIALASAWLFRQPLWVYPAAALAPAALWLALAEGGVPAGRRGWGLIGLGAIYLALAAVLRRLRLGAYATPPLAASFALIALGLPLSSQDRTGAFWAYGAASILYGLAAARLRQPLLLTPAAALVVVPYAVALQSSRLAPDHYGLWLWPGALAALAAGFLLDQRAGAQGGFPWYRPLAWPAAVADRFMSWWALPVYILGFGLASAGPLFSNGRADWQAANLAGLVLVFAWGAYRFRLRGWLFLSALAGQLAAVSTLAWLGWWAQPDRAALAFLPVTLATAALGLYFEHRYREGSPLRVEDLLWGWSRPLYALVALDLIRFTSFGPSLAATLVTLGHGLLLATLASRWLNRVVAYAATALGALALFQWLSSLEGLPATAFPTPFALLAGLLGLGGYGLTLLRADLDERYELKPAAALWEPVLQRAAHGLALLSLLAAAGLGLDLAGWTVRALLGFPFRQVVEVATVLMAVGVFSILGLFYLLVSVVRQRLYLGYLAIGLLLAAWSLYLFFVQALENVQGYALPVGLYLLGISYLEWQRQKAGLRGALARWLDYAAILLMAGTAFWQSLTTPWLYAALLSLEGAGFFWWGSARRLRRIFYAGLVCIVLAVIGQFVQSLLLFNRWIVFGVAGLTLVALAILLERRLEVILERSRDWRERLEMWE